MSKSFKYAISTDLYNPMYDDNANKPDFKKIQEIMTAQIDNDMFDDGMLDIIDGYVKHMNSLPVPIIEDNTPGTDGINPNINIDNRLHFGYFSKVNPFNKDINNLEEYIIQNLSESNISDIYQILQKLINDNNKDYIIMGENIKFMDFIQVLSKLTSK